MTSDINRLVYALATQTLLAIRGTLAERFATEVTHVRFEFCTSSTNEFHWVVSVRQAQVVIPPRGNADMKTKRLSIVGVGSSLQDAIDDLDRDIHIKTSSARVKR